MSGWDAPTGSWDPPEDTEGSGGSDDQAYQQSQPTVGYRTARGGEGILRAGRRGLPGYDQAQAYEQSAGYDQGPDYGQAREYGQAPDYGEGSGYGATGATGYEPPTGPSQSARSAQPGWVGLDDQPDYGTQSFGQQGGFGDAGYGRQASTGQESSGGQDYGQQDYGQQQQYGQQDYGQRYGQQDYGQTGPEAGRGFSSELDQSYQGYRTESYPQQQSPASGGFGEPDQSYQPQGSAGYQTEAYPQRGYEQPGSPLGTGSYGQERYGQDQYGQDQYGQNRYGQDQYGQDQYGQDQYGQDRYGQDQYGQDRYGPDRYGQDRYGPDQYGPDQYGPDQYSQDQYSQDQYGPTGTQGSYAPDVGYGQAGYAQAGYDQAGYGQAGYGQAGYGPDGSLPDAYRQEAYAPAGYVQGTQAQPSFEPLASQPARDAALPGGRRTRSGPPRSAQRTPPRLSGMKMVGYLLLSLIGVVGIVLAVIHLSKSGTNSPASSSSTPSAGSSATHAAAGSGAGYVLTSVAEVGPPGRYPLNAAATRSYLQFAEGTAATQLAGFKASGAGHSTQTVFAVYDLGPVTSTGSSDFKGMSLLGYNGTFNPNAVIKYERTKLVSWRMVPAGPHGGLMMCGYNLSTGSDASDCLWVTNHTFGQVQFIVGGTTVKYPGAQTLALEVRDFVEKRAG
jgi:hypothetical protein